MLMTVAAHSTPSCCHHVYSVKVESTLVLLKEVPF